MGSTYWKGKKTDAQQEEASTGLFVCSLLGKLKHEKKKERKKEHLRKNGAKNGNVLMTNWSLDS